MGYRSAKGAGGNAGSQIHHAFQPETPSGVGEPPSAARDRLEFDNQEDIRIRRGSGLPVERRENAVSVGRDEGHRSDAHESFEIHHGLESHGVSANVGSISHSAPVYEQGRALSAITEGLPGELPPDGQEYNGTVSIPSALIENAQKLSLTLTDYPDQRLQLKMSEIPVAR